MNKQISLRKEIKSIKEGFYSFEVVFEDGSREYFLKNNGVDFKKLWGLK